MSDGRSGQTLSDGEILSSVKALWRQTSLFDRLFFGDTWPFLVVLVVMITVGIDRLAGPFGEDAKAYVAFPLMIATHWLWGRLCRRIRESACDADPTRTCIIRTPELLQSGNEWVSRGRWGRVVLAVPRVAVVGIALILVFLHIETIAAVSGGWLWSVAAIALAVPVVSIIWQLLISLAAGLTVAAESRDQD